MKTILLLLLLFPCALRAQCGSAVDRWKAKTLNDGSKLSDEAPIETTVTKESALARPTGKWGGSARRANERALLKIAGDIIEAGEESDHDFHLVLRDGKETMIVEIPSPEDCGEVTSHRAEYKAARATMEALAGKITGTAIHTVKPVRVTVTGYGFWDKANHGTGHAKNGREIHPALSLVASK